MNNIYVDELPKDCSECPCCNNDIDYGACCNLGAYDYTECHQTIYKHQNCPLKSLTDRLAKTTIAELVNIQIYVSDNAVGAEQECFARELNNKIDQQIQVLKTITDK